MKTDDILRKIRTDLRKAMDGAVSKSMRDLGMDYRMNFGVSILHLQQLSKRYEKSDELAEALWSQEARELKILATMLYPVDSFTEKDAEVWVKQIPNQEIREQVCKNLFQELSFADKLIHNWTASDDDEIRTTGYWLMARLVLSDSKLKESVKLSDIIDRAIQDSISESYFLKNSAQSALKFMGRISKEVIDEIMDKADIYKDSDNSLKDEVYKSLNFEFSLIE